MRIIGYSMGATEFLILANVLVFISTLISPNFIYGNFALMPARIFEQPWTIITSMFIQASFDHILFNMLTLFFFGLYLERLIGEKKLLILYFLGGILGSIFVILLAPPSSITVGASGAIFAVGGALAVLRPNQTVYLFFAVPMPLWIAVIGGFFILSLNPGISWEGHLGGLIAGLIAGYLLKKKISESYVYGVYRY